MYKDVNDQLKEAVDNIPDLQAEIDKYRVNDFLAVEELRRGGPVCTTLVIAV